MSNEEPIYKGIIYFKSIIPFGNLVLTKIYKFGATSLLGRCLLKSISKVTIGIFIFLNASTTTFACSPSEDAACNPKTFENKNELGINRVSLMPARKRFSQLRPRTEMLQDRLFHIQ